MDELDLRSAALQDDDGSVIIEHRGKQYEVRPPTLADQRKIAKGSKLRGEKEADGPRMMALTVIYCTFRPGTEDRVFKIEDLEALENKSADPRTIVGKASRAITKMLAEKPDEVEAGFSDPLADDSSSL